MNIFKILCLLCCCVFMGSPSKASCYQEYLNNGVRFLEPQSHHVSELSPAAMSVRFNIDIQTIEKLSDYSVHKKALIFMRSMTPYYGGLDYEVKLPEVKFKTMKKGPYQGLVGWTRAKLPNYFSPYFKKKYRLVSMEGGYVLLQSRKSKKFLSSDIDLQSFFVVNQSGSLHKINTNETHFWQNFIENQPLLKELKHYIKHGANDDYLDSLGRPLRNPELDEDFYALDPFGAYYEIQSVNDLSKIYEDLGIHWVYGNQ